MTYQVTSLTRTGYKRDSMGSIRLQFAQNPPLTLNTTMVSAPGPSRRYTANAFPLGEPGLNRICNRTGH